MRLRMIGLSAGINPGRYIGATYRTSPLSFDKRALLRLNFVWFVVWVRMPYEHFRPYGQQREWGWCRSMRRFLA